MLNFLACFVFIKVNKKKKIQNRYYKFTFEYYYKFAFEQYYKFDFAMKAYKICLYFAFEFCSYVLFTNKFKKKNNYKECIYSLF